MFRSKLVVACFALLLIPPHAHAQAIGGDDVCLGFEFGTWKPKLDWHAAGYEAFPDSGRVQRSPSGRDWAFGPDKTDSALVLMPSWWPAGIVILLPNREPAPGDTVSGEAIAMRAIADSISPRTRVRAWRVPCVQKSRAPRNRDSI
jgi:hypothetical protein